MFTRSFQYVDLQGSTVPSPTSNEGRVTSSISSNGESTVRIDDISPSNSDSVDKLLRQQRRKRSFMILAGVCGVAVITIIALTYHDSATKIITAIPSAFSSASQGRTGQPFTHHGLISPTFSKSCFLKAAFVFAEPKSAKDTIYFTVFLRFWDLPA